MAPLPLPRPTRRGYDARFRPFRVFVYVVFVLFVLYLLAATWYAVYQGAMHG